MSLAIVDVDRFITNATLRMPFSFGNVTVTEQPQLFVRIELDHPDGRTRGVASDGLSPRWFQKDLGYEEGLAAMLEVIDRACGLATRVGSGATPFAIWQAVYDRQASWGRESPHPPLLWAYGVSLVERALIDAYCRARDRPFAALLREGGFGLDLAAFHHELAGTSPPDHLPARSPDRVAVRHTIGLTDPLTAEDLDVESRVSDGLPQTLVEHVRTHGVQYFKVKLAGDGHEDLARLEWIATVLDQCPIEEYRLTLDANEQYASAEAFRAFWDRLREASVWHKLADRILFVEQPLPRHAAFGVETRSAFRAWPDKPPIVIDESDDRLDSCATALACGYDGTSHKNVKGVFKGVANACRIRQLQAEQPDASYRMSWEDAANVGPVALLQDLAVGSTLGIDHVERNGHQYFRGLTMMPDSIQERVLASHDDLYERHENGFPTVRITDGELRFGSVADAPFGYDVDLELSELSLLESWIEEHELPEDRSAGG